MTSNQDLALQSQLSNVPLLSKKEFRKAAAKKRKIFDPNGMKNEKDVKAFEAEFNELQEKYEKVVAKNMHLSEILRLRQETFQKRERKSDKEKNQLVEKLEQV